MIYFKKRASVSINFKVFMKEHHEDSKEHFFMKRSGVRATLP